MSTEKESVLSASNENYLEAILQLEPAAGEPVRSVDIAAKMGVSRAGVSKAMHLLGDSALISFDPAGQVLLTEEGRGIAREILDRHQMLKRFLTDVLGVEEDEAEIEACRMEHAISEETKKKWIEYLKEIL